MLALPQSLLHFPMGLGKPLSKASSGQAPNDFKKWGRSRKSTKRPEVKFLFINTHEDQMSV
jgi:hypothetical protein